MSGGLSQEPVGAVLCGTGDGMGSGEEGLLWSLLADRPVLAWCLQALVDIPRITELSFLVTPGRETTAKELVEALQRPLGQEIRIESASDASDPLLTALESFSEACRLVVVHQGNRPLVSAGSIVLAMAAADEHPGSAVVAAAPVNETVKRTAGRLVIETPPRAGLLALGTPAVFPREALIRAYRSDRTRSGERPPRSEYLLQQALASGMRVLPIASADGENLAITQWDDLLLAEALLEGRR
jgi:2-C-methyl-D-erythritol 4-phosphate cytidylyltransferase